MQIAEFMPIHSGTILSTGAAGGAKFAKPFHGDVLRCMVEDRRDRCTLRGAARMEYGFYRGIQMSSQQLSSVFLSNSPSQLGNNRAGNAVVFDASGTFQEVAATPPAPAPAPMPAPVPEVPPPEPSTVPSPDQSPEPNSAPQPSATTPQAWSWVSRRNYYRSWG